MDRLPRAWFDLDYRRQAAQAPARPGRPPASVVVVVTEEAIATIAPCLENLRCTLAPDDELILVDVDAGARGASAQFLTSFARAAAAPRRRARCHRAAGGRRRRRRRVRGWRAARRGGGDARLRGVAAAQSTGRGRLARQAGRPSRARSGARRAQPAHVGPRQRRLRSARGRRAAVRAADRLRAAGRVGAGEAGDRGPAAGARALERLPGGAARADGRAGRRGSSCCPAIRRPRSASIWRGMAAGCRRPATSSCGGSISWAATTTVPIARGYLEGQGAPPRVRAGQHRDPGARQPGADARVHRFDLRAHAGRARAGAGRQRIVRGRGRHGARPDGRRAARGLSAQPAQRRVRVRLQSGHRRGAGERTWCCSTTTWW